MGLGGCKAEHIFAQTFHSFLFSLHLPPLTPSFLPSLTLSPSFPPSLPPTPFPSQHHPLHLYLPLLSPPSLPPPRTTTGLGCAVVWTVSQMRESTATPCGSSFRPRPSISVGSCGPWSRSGWDRASTVTFHLQCRLEQGGGGDQGRALGDRVGWGCCMVHVWWRYRLG